MDTASERFDLLLVGTGQATGTLIAGLPDDTRVAVVEGGAIGPTGVDFAAAMARMNEVRHASRDDLTRFLAE